MELHPQRHPRTERVPLVRPLFYEILTSLERPTELNGESRTGQGVLLNISQGGMLLLTTRALSSEVPLLIDNSAFRDVFAVYGLSMVVWTCPLFLAPHLHFVGIRFLQ